MIDIQKKLSIGLLMLATLGISAKPALAQKPAGNANDLTAQTQSVDVVAVHHLTAETNANGGLTFSDNDKPVSYGKYDGNVRTQPTIDKDNSFILEESALIGAYISGARIYLVGAHQKNNTLDLTAVAKDMSPESINSDEFGSIYINKKAELRLAGINQIKIGDKIVPVEYRFRQDLPNRELGPEDNNQLSGMLSVHCLSALEKAISDYYKTHSVSALSQKQTVSTMRSTMGSS